MRSNKIGETGGGARSAMGGSVKVVPARRTAMDEAQRKSANHAETNRAAERKSGALAKTTASRVNTNPPAGKTRTTVSVKSTPTKSTKTKSAAKSDAKALKAANKKAPTKRNLPSNN